MVKRNRSFPLPLPHNDSLPGMRSAKDAIESRGGIFSRFKIGGSLFAEIDRGVSSTTPVPLFADPDPLAHS
jgi:hypothetical protein